MKKLLSAFLILGLLLGLAVPAAATGDTLGTLQQAVVQTALAYFQKGGSLQYDSYAVGNGTREYSAILRQTNNLQPEDASGEDILYTVCSAFVHDVYMSAFGEHIVGRQVAATLENGFEAPLAGGQGLTDAELAFTLALETSTENLTEMGAAWRADGADESAVHGDVMVGYWNADLVTAEGLTWEALAEVMAPGDVIAAFPAGGTGHTMMFLGDIFGDGTDYIIHSNGQKYTYDSELGYAIEQKEARTGWAANNWHNQGGCICINALEHLFGTGKSYNPSNLDQLAVLRPLNTLTQAQLTPQARFRLAYPGLTASKTCGVNRYDDLTAGSQITYTVTLQNDSRDAAYAGASPNGTVLQNGFVPAGQSPAAYTVTLQESIPAGAVLVSADGGITPDTDGVLVWENVSVPAGEPVTRSYTVTVGAAGEITSPAGRITAAGTDGYLTTGAVTRQVVNQQLPAAKEAVLAALQTGSLTPHAYSKRSGTDAAEDVYAAMGYDLELPETAELVEMLTAFTAQPKHASASAIAMDLMMRDPAEVTDPEQLRLLQMAVPGFVGGLRLHTADENMVRSNDGRLLTLDMDSLQPGDILVFANTAGARALTIVESDSVTYVYLGGGKFACYQDEVFTVVDGSVSVDETAPEETSAVLHQAFLQDFFVCLRPSRVGLTAVQNPLSAAAKIRGTELRPASGLSKFYRAASTVYNQAVTGDTMVFHENCSGSFSAADATKDIVIDLNGHSIKGNVTLAASTLKNGTVVGTVTLSDGAGLENVNVIGDITGTAAAADLVNVVVMTAASSSVTLDVDWVQPGGVHYLAANAFPGVTAGTYQAHAYAVPAACRIGETEYLSFSDAWTQAADGATVTLLRDVSTADLTEWGTYASTGKVTYFYKNAGRSLTLDLNGFDLRDPVSASGTFSLSGSGCSVTLKNSAQSAAYIYSGASFCINSKLALTLENVNLVAAGHGLYQDTGSAIITGGSILSGVNRVAKTGNAVVVKASTSVTLDGGAVVGSLTSATLNNAGTLTLRDTAVAAPVYVYNVTGTVTGTAPVCAAGYTAAARQLRSVSAGDMTVICLADVYSQAPEA